MRSNFAVPTVLSLEKFPTLFPTVLSLERFQMLFPTVMSLEVISVRSDSDHQKSTPWIISTTSLNLFLRTIISTFEFDR